MTSLRRTVEHNCDVHQWGIAREEEQHFDKIPFSGPDQGQLATECEEVIICLERTVSLPCDRTGNYGVELTYSAAAATSKTVDVGFSRETRSN